VLLNYHIGRFVLGSLCIGDLVQLGLSGVRVAGFSLQHGHHRLRESCRNLCTEQSPKESDDTRWCTNTIVILKMSIVLLETCRGVQ